MRIMQEEIDRLVYTNERLMEEVMDIRLLGQPGLCRSLKSRIESLEMELALLERGGG